MLVFASIMAILQLVELIFALGCSISPLFHLSLIFFYIDLPWDGYILELLLHVRVTKYAESAKTSNYLAKWYLWLPIGV